MRAIAGGIRVLKQRVIDAYHVSDYSVLAVGVIGALGHPLYWFWWTFVDPQPNENLPMRVVGSIACVLLLLRRFWPAGAARFLPWYYFATVAYTLPFFFTWYLLSGHYSMLWSMAEVGMVFFLIAIFPSFVALAANLVIGVGVAILCAWIVDPRLLAVDSHMLLFVYLPVFAFGICAGVTFSHSNMKGITAQAKNEALRALAGTIAHEMRNPLSQLRYVLDRMEEALPTMTETRPSAVSSSSGVGSLSQHLEHGQLAIDRGLRIIAMTLDEVSAKPVRSDNLTYASAAAATRKALDEYGFSDRKERSKVRLVVLEDFTFKVDETVYLFTLFNLIRNALHHMAANPSATLTLTVERQKVIVHDTGPGIAPEIMSHLFVPFRTHGNLAGTGLGLAYCQRAMRSFGGSIGCRSEVGKFTQFTLEFPVVSEAEVATHRQQVLARATQFFAHKHILLVDDDAGQRARVSQALSGVSAQVSEAESGVKALALLQDAAPFDLILMDINMPGLDGYTTTERIRADRAHANWNALIVGYTSEPHSVARVLAQGAGMDETIGKSISMVELISALQTLMENVDRSRRNRRFDGFAGKTILVADDDTYSRMVAKSYLERCGASVLEAENGLGVLERLNQGLAIDALVIDMNMPGMGGVETAATIRARNDAYAKAPIVALTGQSDMEALRACLDAGMNEVMIKPVRVGALYACLARQFAQTPAASAHEHAETPRTPVARARLASSSAVGHAASRAADNASGRASTPATSPSVAIDTELLDEAHLEELASLDMLDQTFLKGIAQIRTLIGQLADSAQAGDVKAAHFTLHLLLGISGNIGAKALHVYVRQIYPRVLDGQWPTEADWLAQVTTLGNRSADALQRYFVASSSANGYRDALNDE
ncbi:ATP-binding response regulator [Paraburkholderia tropica]|uniref:ATP-binding response regulator n=1 Tax=Paraburkholderia tropica TaxID=92647 RepID=UPI002AB05B4D|nr:response regulator [Paraburkholderia tropica]